MFSSVEPSSRCPDISIPLESYFGFFLLCLLKSFASSTLKMVVGPYAEIFDQFQQAYIVIINYFVSVLKFFSNGQLSL